MAEFDNYDNPYATRDYVKGTVVPFIYEVLVDSYGYAEDDYDNEDTYDHVWEIIDGLYEVIYNYPAKRVAEAFGMSAFDHSEVTGERYSSYNEMAFEKIQQLFNDKYADQLHYMI